MRAPSFASKDKMIPLALNDDTAEDSCNDEQLTARGSHTGVRSRERQTEKYKGGINKKEDLQQEKHKIWMQSIIDDQGGQLISEPFAQ